MGDNMATSGGGLHPGRPVIWPTSKSTPTSSAPQTTAGSQTAQAAAQQAAKLAPTPAEISQAQAAAKLLSQGAVARQFSQADLRALLLSQNIPSNEANEKLATLMLRYGVEVSSANFTKLNSMMGAAPDQTSADAAILLLMKGIDSPAAAKTLSKFLAENPQLASQLSALKGNIQDLQSALAMGKGIIGEQMLAQLAAILAQFSDEIDTIPGKYKFSGKGSMGRGELAGDLRALKALLDGVPDKQNLPDSAEGQIIKSNINATSNKLDQMIQSVISQAMLSKQSQKPDVNYTYYQIPNAMVTPHNTIELIVKRSDTGGGKRIDPNNTEIIMSFDTNNLGKVAIKMVIKDKKVEFIFNTMTEDAKNVFSERSKELAKAISEKDFIPAKVQVNVNPSMCSIKPFLIPFLGIEDLMKIDISA